MLGRFLTNAGLARDRAARIPVSRCRAVEARDAVACLESALRLRRPSGSGDGPDADPGHRIVVALWGAMSQAPPLEPSERAWLTAAAPFAMPRAALAPARWRRRRRRPCLTLQLRLHDRRCFESGGAGGCRVNGVEEARVGEVPAWDVLMRSRDADTAATWGNLSVVGVVERARVSAARRGLGLYVLMPYVRPVFEVLARMDNVSTVQVTGMPSACCGAGGKSGRAGSASLC